MLEVAPTIEHIANLGQSIDGGAELGTLTGRVAIVGQESLVMDRVDVEEDATSCLGVGVAIVATCTINRDDDGFAVSRAIATLKAPHTVLAFRQFDFVVVVRALAHRAAIAASSHEVVFGHVAFVVAPVIRFAPSSVRNVAAIDRILHDRHWVECILAEVIVMVESSQER